MYFIVYISSHKNLLDYCKSNNIRPEDFNEPVTLPENAFDGVLRFNNELNPTSFFDNED